MDSILRLTEESLAPVSCLGENAEGRPRASRCNTLPLWQGLDNAIHAYLKGITIADLMAQGSAGDDYVI